MLQIRLRRCARTLGVALALALALAPIPALAQPPSIGRSPDAGAARPWEAGLQVARHSSVNLYNGNMLTVIPIFRCDPVGPALEFNLYHNSATAGATERVRGRLGLRPGRRLAGQLRKLHRDRDRQGHTDRGRRQRVGIHARQR